MGSNNRGRSTTGEAAVPYYLSTSCREAAKHLRLTVSRYLADRATIGDVEEASRMMLHTAADEDPVTIHQASGEHVTIVYCIAPRLDRWNPAIGGEPNEPRSIAGEVAWMDHDQAEEKLELYCRRYGYDQDNFVIQPHQLLGSIAGQKTPSSTKRRRARNKK